MKKIISFASFLLAALSLSLPMAFSQIVGGGGGGGSGGTPGGTNGQVQYNNAGSFGGLAVGGALTTGGGTLNVTTGGISNAMLAGSIDLTTKVTGILPVANGGTGISSLGTGTATALGINVGSAGAFLVNGGALGTPSSGIGTNLTGTAAGLTAGHVTTNADLTGPITSTGNATAIANGAIALNKLGGETDGNCVVGVAGAWTSGACAGGGGSVSVTAATPNTVVTPSPGTSTFTIGTTVPQNSPADGGSHSYTVLSSDLTKQVILAGTFTAAAVPQATGSFAAGSSFSLFNKGAVTATPTTSTVNGAASIALAANQTSEWVSDGTNWLVTIGAALDPSNATNLASGTVAAPRLPLATTGAFGAVKPDGSTITVSAGVISSVSGGAGTVTAVTLGPGLAKTIGTQNTGSDQITTTGTINTQLFPVTKATSYSVAAADTGNELIATGASVTFTLPNPASGTKGTTFNFGSDGTNGFTLATVGTTANFYGCTPVGAGATTLVVELNIDVMVVDDGTGYKCVTMGTRTVSYSLTYAPGINPNNLPITNFRAARIIVGIRCTPEVLAGGAATISVVKAASATAISAGSALHSGSCNANSGAATDQDLTVTTTALTAGDRLGITTTGTTVWTSSGVAAGVVTVFVR